jgi:hypothetical protein
MNPQHFGDRRSLLLQVENGQIRPALLDSESYSQSFSFFHLKLVTDTFLEVVCGFVLMLGSITRQC